MTTTIKAIPTEVAEYLQLHHIITLSTASFTGMPHANTVAYANDATRLYFLVPDDAQIVRNVHDNRYVSFTIDDYTTDWRKVRELQGVGGAQALIDHERAIGLNAFVEKFGPGVALPEGIVFALRPFEMHFVDYRYEAVTANTPEVGPEITSRVFQFDGTAGPTHGAVSTSLGRRVLGAGEVVFRPADSVGQYFVVLQGRGRGPGGEPRGRPDGGARG